MTGINDSENYLNFARKINSILTVSDFDFKVFVIYQPVSYNFTKVFALHTKNVIHCMEVSILYPSISAHGTAERHRDAADSMHGSAG